MAVNDDILNRHMLHLVSLQRQYNSLDRSVQRELDTHSDNIRTIIMGPGSVNNKVDRTGIEVRRAYRVLNAMVTDNVTRIGTNETRFQQSNLQRSMGGLYTVQGVSPRLFRSALNTASLTTDLSTINGSRTFDDWMNGISATELNTLQSTIRAGFIENLTPEEIVTNASSALNRGKASTRSLVRTSYTHSQNMASDMVYQQNEDVLRGYEWLSTLDTRTSGICRNRDGKMYKIGSGVYPPAHFNCRSTTIPIVKSLDDIPVAQSRKDRLTGRRRASFTGQVPAELDYDSWLRLQSPDTQDEILGVAQASIFRRGKLNISKFTNIYGKDISMDRLLDLDRNVIKSSTYGTQYQRGQDVSQYDIVQPIINANDLLDNQEALVTFMGAHAYIANINRGQLNFASVNFTTRYRAHLKANNGTIYRGSRRNRVNNDAWNTELALLEESGLSSQYYRFIVNVLGELTTVLRGNQRIVAIRALRKFFDANDFNSNSENFNRYFLARLNYEARQITRTYLRDYQE